MITIPYPSFLYSKLIFSILSLISTVFYFHCRTSLLFDSHVLEFPVVHVTEPGITVFSELTAVSAYFPTSAPSLCNHRQPYIICTLSSRLFGCNNLGSSDILLYTQGNINPPGHSWFCSSHITQRLNSSSSFGSVPVPLP